MICHVHHVLMRQLLQKLAEYVFSSVFKLDQLMLVVQVVSVSATVWSAICRHNSSSLQCTLGKKCTTGVSESSSNLCLCCSLCLLSASKFSLHQSLSSVTKAGSRCVSQAGARLQVESAKKKQTVTVMRQFQQFHQIQQPNCKTLHVMDTNRKVW